MATVSATKFFGGKPPAPTTTQVPINHLDGFSVLDAARGSIQQAAEGGLNKISVGVDRATHPQSPLDVVTGATKAAAGAVETATSPLAPLFSPLGKIIGYVANKLSDTPLLQDYGRDTASLPANEQTAPEKILDFASDAGVVAGAASGVKAAPGAVARASNALSEARTALGDISATGAEGIKEAASKALNPASLMQRVARVSKAKQVAFEERAGAPVGQYLVDRGIFGTPDKIVDQLYTRFQASKSEADAALAKLPGTYR